MSKYIHTSVGPFKIRRTSNPAIRPYVCIYLLIITHYYYSILLHTYQAGIARRLTLGVGKIRRHSDHGLGHGAANKVLGDLFKIAQYRRGHLLRRYDLLLPIHLNLIFKKWYQNCFVTFLGDNIFSWPSTCRRGRLKKKLNNTYVYKLSLPLSLTPFRSLTHELRRTGAHPHTCGAPRAGSCAGGRAAGRWSPGEQGVAVLNALTIAQGGFV